MGAREGRVHREPEELSHEEMGDPNLSCNVEQAPCYGDGRPGRRTQREPEELSLMRR